MAESAPAFAQHEDLEVTASGKCRCKITGHEMAMQQGVVEAHLNGKKYRKMKALQAAQQYDFAQHQPHIVQHKKDPRKLFCNRTKLHLNKVPAEVEVHIKGRRFRARLQEWEEKQKRRAAKAARAQAKAEHRDACKAAAAARAGSDEEEDPVLAKFAHLANEDDSDADDDSDVDDDSDADDNSDADAGEVMGSAEPEAAGDGQEEMDAARSAKAQYASGRVAAQKHAEQDAEDDGSDFEVVAASEDSDAASDDDGALQKACGAAMGSQDVDSEDEPPLTAAKKLSLARQSAREERDDASQRQAPKGAGGAHSSKGKKTKDEGVQPEQDRDLVKSANGDPDSGLPAIWHHGAVVQDKHHGRSGKRHRDQGTDGMSAKRGRGRGLGRGRGGFGDRATGKNPNPSGGRGTMRGGKARGGRGGSFPKP